MAEGFGVDPDQLRVHAGHLDELRSQFAAVTGASTSITQDSAAFGTLCAWIGAILAGKHATQDELYAYFEENLALAADSLRQAGAAYEASDGTAAQGLGRIGAALR